MGEWWARYQYDQPVPMAVLTVVLSGLGAAALVAFAPEGFDGLKSFIGFAAVFVAVIGAMWFLLLAAVIAAPIPAIMREYKHRRAAENAHWYAFRLLGVPQPPQWQ